MTARSEEEVEQTAQADQNAGQHVEAVDHLVPEAAAAYECALTLVQPDGFVAWRGESLPSEAGAILDRVRGVSP